MLLVGSLAVAALASWLLARLALEPGPAATPSAVVSRPVTTPGCFGCLLAREAGDEFLRRHLERECAV